MNRKFSTKQTQNMIADLCRGNVLESTPSTNTENCWSHQRLHTKNFHRVTIDSNMISTTDREIIAFIREKDTFCLNISTLTNFTGKI